MMPKIHISAATLNRCISFARAAQKLKHEAARFAHIVEDPSDADLQIFVGVPIRDQLASFTRAGKKFVWLSMCEQTIIPPDWVDTFNRDMHVIVPCNFCQYVFDACGVLGQIHVVRLGVDVNEHPYIHRPERDTYTFFWQGTSLLHDRKCGYLVEQAFRELDLPKSKLIIKTIPFPGPTYDITMGNIRQVNTWATIEDMQKLDYEADCFVWPTRAEGFGMLPLEKMSTGMAVICTDWSGPRDYLVDDVSIPIREFQYQESIYGPQCGHDAKVSLETVKRHMLWCYNHREEAMQMGVRASQYVKDHWTWHNRSYRELKSAVENILQ